jgi:hypothetical protein
VELLNQNPQQQRERLFQDPRRVEVSFDWEPHVEECRVSFQICIRRRGQKSALNFEVDLNQLSALEQERLYAFLARRHAGTSTHYDLAWNISWLLEISLRQKEPKLAPTERRTKMRELLLAGQEPGSLNCGALKEKRERANASL